MKFPKRTEQAARSFLLELWPAAAEPYGGAKQEVFDLVASAFHLYRLAWGPEWDIRAWKWPLNELRANRDFAGTQPWAVLLRKAVSLAHVNTEIARC